MNRNGTPTLPGRTDACNGATSTTSSVGVTHPEAQAGKAKIKADVSGIEWLTKTEIAKHLKCSIRHINNLMCRRVLPFVKLGRFVRFDRAACDLAMKKIQTKSLFG